MNITIETLVQAPVAQVWAAWNDPRAIERWNTASPDWHTTAASVDLRPGQQLAASGREWLGDDVRCCHLRQPRR